jgi:glycosyltransferase involved in cell wall biosynthesis
MKVFSLLVAKDEADIVSETIRAALTWSEAVCVLDNASSDGTWEAVIDLARETGRVFPYLRTDEEFFDGIRARLYNAYRHLAGPGDWWCRLDADEFYVDDPRDILATVASEHNAVYGSMFKYYFTGADAATYRADPATWLAEPVRQRLRWYRNDWSELRFHRHLPRARWVTTPWPEVAAVPYNQRIRLRHYQYRSPDQIVHRLLIRRSVDTFAHERARWAIFPHEPTPEEPWLERTADESLLDHDDGRSPLIERPELIGPLPRPPGRVARWITDHAVRTHRRVRR